MASIQKDIALAAAPDAVWDALRDYGAVATRVAPGFLTGCTLEGDVRVVSFANGMTARERLVGLDDAARRLAYTIEGERMTHHNAAFQVTPDGSGSRVTWTADVLPDAAAEMVAGMMDHGLAAMKAKLGSGTV